MQMKEGDIDFKGFKTHYYIYGDITKEKPPLLVLHGGPGYTHYYLENLAGLAENGQPVIFYDQIGCGKSTKPDDPSLWTIEFFVNELATVRKALNLKHVSILGQSWGGTLAVEYMFTNPDGVDKLILSSPLLDTKIWVDEANRLINELPEWATKAMHQHETNGTTDSLEYKQAYAEFKKRHICRTGTYPEAMAKSDQEASDQVYGIMWGPNETLVTGTLKDWSSLDRISQIKTPTLFISGKYDEATPKQIKSAHDLLPDSRWVLMENCSHMPNLEEPVKYLNTVADFLGSRLSM